jgi:hypothetical protein
MTTLCTNGSTQGSQSIFLTDEAVLPCIDGVLTPKYTDTIGLRQQVQISKGPEAGYRSLRPYSQNRLRCTRLQILATNTVVNTVHGS